MTTQFQRNVLLVDLDGTLTNPAKGIIGCFRFALHAVGCAAPPSADLGWIIGPPLRQTFSRILGAMADVEKALAIYRTRYGAEGLFEAVVYDGAPEALSQMRRSGARLFLCTSKPTVYANRILDYFDLGGYFDEAYGSELDGRLEDKGDLIAHILAERGFDSADCVMWGDRKHDVAGAKRHAIPTIGALWGFGGEKELREAGAAALCAAPDEVPAAFDRLRGSRTHVKSWSRVINNDSTSRPPVPPRAEPRPLRRSAHGVDWIDEYAWIRAENWREVLRDPGRLPLDIRALLEAENAYADALLAPTAELQRELVREMRARLREDDSEPPQVDGPWAYYSRYRQGGQYRIYCRRPREGGDEMILLDGDVRAEGRPFFRLTATAHAPDHAKFAWSFDELGSEMLTIRVRDIERSEDLPDRIANATDDIVWTRDFEGASLCRAGRESSAVPGHAASPGDRPDRGRRGLRRDRPGLVHRHLGDEPRSVGVHRRAWA